MYKLIIVDDEEMIREGIANGISWCDLGFQVVGQACNGLEAIEIINKFEPDVVVTDIRMPDMDGVELMEYLYADRPSIKIIVLSGYSDFGYLKSSIKTNVFDYLLKPTQISKFVEMFRNLKLTMDEEVQRKQEYQNMKQSLTENLPYLEQLYLNRLIAGMYTEINEIEEKNKFYKLDLSYRKLAVICLEVDNPHIVPKEFPKKMEKLIKPYIVGTANKIASDTIHGRFFLGDDGNIVGICCLDSGIKNLVNMLKEIQKCVCNYNKQSLSAGVSNEFENILEINGYYRQARQAIGQKLCFESRSIILYSTIENVMNDKETKVVGEIKRYIEKNFSDNNLCLNSVAEKFKKSPQYLSKIFKEECCENFSDYITRLRMEKAKVLLNEVTVKVYEVPAMVGYADIPHFSKKFKAYTGVSPSQYKREYIIMR